MLAGRHVVLGVSGGVAAYKSAYLVRRLSEAGADVRVVMTDAATEFVGPSTFAALTGHQPVVSLFGGDDVSPHTNLAAWADVIVIAPATASTIAKIASGDSSNALVATVMASTAPTIVAPAMHTEMWEHPATQDNVATLARFGYTIVPPESGELAGGDTGVGRLADPDAIVEVVSDILRAGDMAGMTVLVSAGGTREPIDPVRYIGNRSSGKMGNAIALDAARRGARVTLVTTVDAPEHPMIDVVRVETAQEMAEAVWAGSQGATVAVMAAAVADFQPAATSDVKLRRAAGPPSVELEPTPDILKGVVERGGVDVVVGFAAETGSVDAAAVKALDKGVDLLVANDVAKEGSGFGSDTNEVTLVFSDGRTESLPLMPKADVAHAILTAAISLRG